MLFQDLRYAVRTLLANPGFTATAILCLSLGIGLNSAIFSVVDGVLLQPFPYPDPDRIVVLNSTNQRAGVNRGGLSWLDVRDIREQTTTLSAIAAFTGRSLTVSDGDVRARALQRRASSRHRSSASSARRRRSAATSPQHDDRAGAERVVMLSDDVWKLRYNGDPVDRRPLDLRSTDFRTPSSASCRRSSCFPKPSGCG